MRDLIFLTSVALIVYGCYTLSEPLAILAAGGFGLLVWAAVCYRSEKDG